MNRLPITYNHRITCEHPRCVRLRGQRSEAIRERRFDQVNRLTRLLSLCPEQRKRWDL